MCEAMVELREGPTGLAPLKDVATAKHPVSEGDLMGGL